MSLRLFSGRCVESVAPDHNLASMSTPAFTYQALPMRVVLGAGEIQSLPAEIDRLGLRRALVLCGPEQAETGRRIAAALGDRAAGVLAEARMHVPIEVADQARDRARELGADGCVAVGGGSAIGLGKAIALAHGLPVVAVPTTYAGSEMTPVWGLTQDGQKRTGRDPRVLPRQRDLRPGAHPHPAGRAVGDQRAERRRARRRGAVRARRDPDRLADGRGGHPRAGRRAAGPGAGRADLEARSRAQYGAWLCGACLGATTMSVHHKLCHSPRRDAGPAARADARRGAAACVGASTSRRCRTPWRRCRARWAGRPTRRGGCGTSPPSWVPRGPCANSGWPRPTSRGSSSRRWPSPYANPVEVTADRLTRLLHAAWAGDPPQPLFS